MKERAISVTEASRNFAECINRVRYQGISYLLLKNGAPVARLIPESATSVQQPAAVLAPDSPQYKPLPESHQDKGVAAGPAAIPSEDRQQEIRRRVLQW